MRIEPPSHDRTVVVVQRVLLDHQVALYLTDLVSFEADPAPGPLDIREVARDADDVVVARAEPVVRLLGPRPRGGVVVRADRAAGEHVWLGAELGDAPLQGGDVG
jgi:hypothetical protein